MIARTTNTTTTKHVTTPMAIKTKSEGSDRPSSEVLFSVDVRYKYQ